MHKKGFTLIELLVVIAIIVVLAGILFSVLATTRNRGYDISCLSNLKQIGLAFEMYSQDYDGYFPPAVDIPPGAGSFYWGDVSWLGKILPYTTNRHLYLCPLSGGANPDWTQSIDALSSYGTYPSAQVRGLRAISATTFKGKALFEGVLGATGAPYEYYTHNTLGHKSTRIGRPSDQILILDHYWFDGGFSYSVMLYPVPRHVKGKTTADIERGFCNCVFADGHAKALQHGAVWEIGQRRTIRGEVESVYIHWWAYE